jgi:hypothetical protein
VSEYLQEEIRVLREIHGQRPRFTDRQRKRLAAKAKKIRSGRLGEIAGISSTIAIHSSPTPFARSCPTSASNL